MKLNFDTIKHPGMPVIEIEVAGKVIDLHNACEFLGFEFANSARTLTTKWKYYPDYQENNFQHFKIVFSQVQSIRVTTWDTATPFSENETLEELKIDNDTGKVALAFQSDFVIELCALEGFFEFE